MRTCRAELERGGRGRGRGPQLLTVSWVLVCSSRVPRTVIMSSLFFLSLFESASCYVPSCPVSLSCGLATSSIETTVRPHHLYQGVKETSSVRFIVWQSCSYTSGCPGALCTLVRHQTWPSCFCLLDAGSASMNKQAGLWRGCICGCVCEGQGAALELMWTLGIEFMAPGLFTCSKLLYFLSCLAGYFCLFETVSQSSHFGTCCSPVN